MTATAADGRGVRLATAGLQQLTALVRARAAGTERVSEAWAVRDVLAHLVAGLSLYVDMAEGVASPIASVDDVPSDNIQRAAQVHLADVDQLCDAVEHGWATFLTAMDRNAPSAEVTWHAGARMPIGALGTLMAGEFYVHGFDVARALGAPWSIPDEVAAVSLDELGPIYPLLVDAAKVGGFTGRFELRIRGHAERTYLRFDHGVLEVEETPGGRVDCHISGRGDAMLLVLYHRRGPWRPALAGQMVSWGRRPWWGLRLPGFFRAP